MTAREMLLVFPGGSGWLRIAGGLIVGRGADDIPSPGDDVDVALVVGATDVTFYAVNDLVGLAPAQAQAVARMNAAESSISPVEALHVAVGNGIAVIARDRMAELLADAQARGIDPDIMIPAPLLLPELQSGFARGLIGGEPVLRGHGIGFGDDNQLTCLIAAGAHIRTLDDAEVDAAIITAVRAPAVNLRQGEFARQRDWRADRARLMQALRLTAVIGALALLIPFATILRLNQQSGAYEREARRIAGLALGGNSAAAVAPAQLDAALASLRGGGAGFLPTAQVVISAVERTPNVELITMAFDDDGTLRVGARATSAAELVAFAQHVRNNGFAVVAGAPANSQGQPVVDIQVRPK